jgi:hypothetical protein
LIQIRSADDDNNKGKLEEQQYTSSVSSQASQRSVENLIDLIIPALIMKKLSIISALADLEIFCSKFNHVSL